MKINKIIKRLKDIEKIANFQQKRLKDKEAINKTITLKQALELIGFQILNILKDLENQK